MEIFTTPPDYAGRISDAGRSGYAFTTQALSRDFTKALANEVLNGKFSRFFDIEQGVYQRFEVFAPVYFDESTRQDYPLMRELGDTLGQMIRASAGRYKCLQTWQPNDVAVQRYSDRYDGIGRHRDYSSDIHLIVSYTIVGTGELKMYSTREDNVPSRVLQTGPGSELIMRAPGLYPTDEDVRPTHSVPPPICGPRVSLTYRLATKPGLKGG